MTPPAMLDLLKRLAEIDSSRCSMEDDEAEVVAYPHGSAFLVTNQRSGNWDKLRCLVERWAIKEGFSLGVDYYPSTNTYRVQFFKGSSEGATMQDPDPAIATVAAYLEAIEALGRKSRVATA